jgi:hypothetical protein
MYKYIEKTEKILEIISCNPVIKSIEIFKDKELNSISLVHLLLRSYDDNRECKLYLSIDIDNDEIILTSNPPNNCNEYELLPISDDIFQCVNSRMIWFWRLQNQNGYFDAVQFECRTQSDKRFMFQFLVIASRIMVYRLELITV